MMYICLGKPSFKKYRNFMKFFHKQGRGSTGFHISYSEMLGLKITHYQACQTIHLYSSEGSFSHILEVHCTNMIENLNFE